MIGTWQEQEPLKAEMEKGSFRRDNPPTKPSGECVGAIDIWNVCAYLYSDKRTISKLVLSVAKMWGLESKAILFLKKETRKSHEIYGKFVLLFDFLCFRIRKEEEEGPYFAVIHLNCQNFSLDWYPSLIWLFFHVNLEVDTYLPASTLITYFF